jgi:drug/metabolite transporter superfamily protein YnfA
MPQVVPSGKLTWDALGRLLCPVCGHIMDVRKTPRGGREYAAHCGASVTCSDEDLAALKRSASPSKA